MKIAEYLDLPMTERAGGVGTYIKSLTDEFLRGGHNVVLIDGLGKPRLFSNRYLIRICKDADIHHLHEPSTALLSCYVQAITSGSTDIVVTFHAPVSDRALERIYSLLAPVLYRKVRLILTTTRRNEEYLASKGVHARVVPLWADEFFRPAASDRYQREPYVLSVCAVDNFHRYKNYRMLSKLGELLKSEFRVNLIHIGVHDIDLPYVNHYGPVDRRTLRELYRKAMAFVLPSIGPYEGFGIVAAEALACATPVLVSYGCGISEFLDSYFASSLEDFENKLCTMVDDLSGNPRPYIDKAYQQSLRFSCENRRRTVQLILSAITSAP